MEKFGGVKGIESVVPWLSRCKGRRSDRERERCRCLRTVGVADGVGSCQQLCRGQWAFKEASFLEE